MKPDRAPAVIRMDPMDSPRSLAIPWDDLPERQDSPETSSKYQAQPRTRAKYRTMVSLLNAIEENTPTIRSVSCIGAKELLSDGDFTHCELSRTARDYDETEKRLGFEQISDQAVSGNISQNNQIVANGDYLLDLNLSTFYENATPERKPSSVSSELPKGHHRNSHVGATSIPASLELLRVDRSQVVCFNRRSKSLSADLNADFISPKVAGISPYNWFSERNELGDNRKVMSTASAQKQDVFTGDDSKGYVRNRHGSGYSSESLSVCSEGGNSCKIFGNGASTTPVEMRPWSGGWANEYDEDSSGLDVVLFRPTGPFDLDVEDDETPIVSSRGTVRGMRNKVKVGIAVFDESKDTCKNYRLVEKGKVVLYTTSVMVIRETHERCQAVKKILQNHMIQFEERDVSVSKDFQRELVERIGSEHFELPQTFAGGFSLGGPEEIEHLNETGILRKMFKNVKKVRSTATSCCKCGGYSYVPCPTCRGSKKSARRNTFSEQFCALRCTNCDDNGLVRCDLCGTY